MKTLEDEAFDELARKQGSWGGGFTAKRKMAADKYSDIVSDGGLDPRNKMDAQPAQEPVGWADLQKKAQQIVESKFLWKRFIDGTPLANDIACWMADFARQYTTPPQREWVGLTEEERNKFDRLFQMSCSSITVYDQICRVEAKLKEKNNG